MAFTQDDLAAINEAIASGELTVDFGDRKVTYRSVAELERAKRHIVKCMAGEQGKRPPRGVRINVSKGA